MKWVAESPWQDYFMNLVSSSVSPIVSTVITEGPNNFLTGDRFLVR